MATAQGIGSGLDTRAFSSYSTTTSNASGRPPRGNCGDEISPSASHVRREVDAAESVAVAVNRRSLGRICVLYDKRPSAFGDAVMVAAAEVVNDMGAVSAAAATARLEAFVSLLPLLPVRVPQNTDSFRNAKAVRSAVSSPLAPQAPEGQARRSCRPHRRTRRSRPRSPAQVHARRGLPRRRQHPARFGTAPPRAGRSAGIAHEPPSHEPWSRARGTKSLHMRTILRAW
jgi:hypothetical protein